MEQIYMVEIFIDKVTVFVNENEDTSAGKKLIVKINFGPKVLFIAKEDMLSKNATAQDDIMDTDENGNRKYTRVIRVGVSYLFPSCPDLMLIELSKCPLEIEVWNDDDTENPIYVGVGKMKWDPEFYVMLQETAKPCANIEPLTIKQDELLWAECCCKPCGEVSFILRVTALGLNIITEFQQPVYDPESILFQTNKSPAMFVCKRIEGPTVNFCMVGTLYETTTLENPDITKRVNRKIEICTQLRTCGLTCTSDYGRRCKHLDKRHTKNLYPIDKITMGDISGPCGNPNCILAQKIRKYIRNLDIYKATAANRVRGVKDDNVKKLCGLCVCKDDTVHREICESYKTEAKLDNCETVCEDCKSLTPSNDICKHTTTNVLYKIYNRFDTFKGSKGKTVSNVDNIFPENTWHNDKKGISATCASSCINLSSCISDVDIPKESQSYDDLMTGTSSKNHNEINNNQQINYATIMSQLTAKDQDDVCSSNSSLYGRKERVYQVYNFCTDIPEERDCRCNPPVPPVPCRTFNCDCIAEIGNRLSRKNHKPYCPLYKHKPACPINFINVDEEETPEEVEEVEPLPYGLPPIKLGPCPILGKPCTYPDGFSRMYRTGAMANQPKSYSDAGKVCCSKEYERIKKAVKEYMRVSKENDMRCKNKYIVDTETRCCDHEQRLFSLMGRECCGRHKLGLQELYPKPNQPSHSHGK